MSLESSKVNETSNIANEATARRFVLPLKVDSAEDNRNLVTLPDCKATATVLNNPGTKPKVFLTPQHLTKDWMELPRINYHYNANKYNFFYSISNFTEKTWTTPEPDSVSKINENVGVRKCKNN